GVGAERTAAALGSAANAGRLERGATKLADMVAENTVGALAQNSQRDNAQSLATDLGVGVAGSGLARAITPILGKAYNAVVQRTTSPASTDINTANDIVQLARSKAGRESIATQAAKIDPDVAKAADVAGVDINALTPGMRSGSTGIAQTEGVLSSTPGIAQDAHMKAFDEIKSKLNKNLEELGAEAGTASEKSATIKGRVISNLDEMRDAEWKAWNDVRSTMPNQKMKMANANAVVQSEKSAGVPLSPEMKQFVSAYKKGGITFDGMKAWRAKFADAAEKYSRKGEANAARRAGEIRQAITQDMQKMAQQGGFLEDWTKANELSKARITAQKDAEAIFGRDLSNDVLITKGVSALQSSSKKGLKDFHKIMKSVPKDEYEPTIASILQDAASQGVRGGKSEGAGISHIAKILTRQNINVIRQYSPELGKLAESYGILAKAASRPLKSIEHTGRSVPALKTLNGELPKILQIVSDPLKNKAVGAIAGYAGGGVAGSILGSLASSVLYSGLANLASKRSGRYAIEKAIQEATKAVNAGASNAAIKAAENRFLKNKSVMKVLRDTLSREEFQQMSRVGFVATISGMTKSNNNE
ncbi:DNA transfer protein, partial [Arsenophonus nasoniae]|uniref:DNA transfer protein n=1 Tax=Arsenophonus nasoniae TaxID=638 RepID=UPI003879A948